MPTYVFLMTCFMAGMALSHTHTSHMARHLECGVKIYSTAIKLSCYIISLASSLVDSTLESVVLPKMQAPQAFVQNNSHRKFLYARGVKNKSLLIDFIWIFAFCY